MAEISAWDIYWVLQLDSFIAIAAALLVTGGVVSAGAVICGWIDLDWAESFPNTCEKQAKSGLVKLKFAKRLALAAIPLAFLVALLPSSRTAAAMYVLPAIVNNKTLQKEAGDLYGLAKQALQNAAGDEERQK